MRNLEFKKSEGGAAITVKITPRAPKNQITGVMENGTIKIRLNAPPVDGKANLALIQFLAETVGVLESKIEIVAGQTNRTKIISFIGISSQELHNRILAIINAN
jgi:uncharacterized protein (TIGR00251 family)